MARKRHKHEAGDTTSRRSRGGRRIARLCTACLLLIIGGFLGGMLSRSWNANASARHTAAPPSSLLGLLEIVQKSDISVDIARVNLLCAQGLPGAENLDLESSLVELDRWAEHVRRETDRHLYRYTLSPAEYENSESYFRILMLIVALQGDLGVHYNADRIETPDFTNSKDLFIHGMIGDVNGGTCVSMPALYVAVGRRLGYPLRLVLTKGHVFARWDDGRERFNIEATSRGLNTYDDEEYTKWPYQLSEAEKNNGWYLCSLEPADEFAVFLMQRGHCLEDNGRLAEAQVAYALAHQLAPRSRDALSYLIQAVRIELNACRSSVEAAPSRIANRTFENAMRARQREWTEEHVEQVLREQEQRIHRMQTGVLTPIAPIAQSGHGGLP